MKRIILLIGILAIISGCQNDFLNEVPQDFIGPDQFFQNGDDAESAVNSVYNALHSEETKRLNMVIDLPAEAVIGRQTAYTSGSYGGHDNGFIDETTGNLGLMWKQYYKVISRANIVLAKVGEMDDSKIGTPLKNRIMGEAYFLRSLSYFTLVRMFGGVPLQLEAIESLKEAEPRARNTDEEIYNQVIADLEQAISLLPQRSTYSGDDIGRASVGSAKALLAKVYLQRGSLDAHNGITGERKIARPDDFQKSAVLCQEVIDGGEYQLVPYKDLWGLDAVDNNDEVIFAAQMSEAVNSNWSLYFALALKDSDLPHPSKGTYLLPHIRFYNSFTSSDIRKSVIFYSQYVMDGETITYNVDDPANDGYFSDTPAFAKYITNWTIFSPADVIYLRYADVLLMKAEALNEVNSGPDAEAYAAINEVRSRVGLDDLTAGLAYTQFKDSVYIERQKEFVMEAQAWFDGQRYFSYYKQIQEEWSGYDKNGPLYGPVYKIILEEKDRLFPIEINVLDRNPLLIQNSGWKGWSHPL